MISETIPFDRGSLTYLKPLGKISLNITLPTVVSTIFRSSFSYILNFILALSSTSSS